MEEHGSQGQRGNMKAGHPRVLVVDLDRATFKILDPLVKRGMMPTIARIIGEGVVGELGSSILPITAPAWSTFMGGPGQAARGVRLTGGYRMYEEISAWHRRAREGIEVTSSLR